MTELLKIRIRILQMQEVCNGNSIARMILFDGDADSRFFKGRVLPGGVDTQTESSGRLTLSARYMLEGVDDTGAPCRIFVENSALLMAPGPEPIHTAPTVITDSPALAPLFAGKLQGLVEPIPKSEELMVRIWSCEEQSENKNGQID